MTSAIVTMAAKFHRDFPGVFCGEILALIDGEKWKILTRGTMAHLIFFPLYIKKNQMFYIIHRPLTHPQFALESNYTFVCFN